VLDIGAGHQLSIVTYLLGRIRFYQCNDGHTLPNRSPHGQGPQNPQAKPSQPPTPTKLHSPGCLNQARFPVMIWRGGLKSTPGRKQFIWEVDGEEGSIRLEGDSAFMNVREPKVFLNGELVEVQNAPGPADILAAAWMEYAKGGKGKLYDYGGCGEASSSD